MNLAKWIGATLALIVILVIAGLMYVVIGIDPNSYKPEITKLAEQKGISLEISGSLSWQFLPNLAIQIGETQVSSITQSIPDTRFKSASLSLSWMALLKRQIAVQSIRIDEANINLDNRQQAAAVAVAPVAAAVGAEDSEPTSQAFSLAIDELKITDSTITLPGGQASGDTPGGSNSGSKFQHFDLSVRELNLEGTPFAVDTAFEYQDPSLPGPLGVSLHTYAAINQADEQLAISKATVELSIRDLPPVKINLELLVDGKKDTLQVPLLTVASNDLNAEIKIDASDLRGDIQGLVQIDIPTMNLRETLDNWGIDLTSLPTTALQKFALRTQIKGSTNKINVKALSLRLDEFTADGNIELKLTAPKTLNVQLTGSKLDVSRYLAPNDDAETSDTETTAQQAPTGNLFLPLLAPLVWLEGGSGDIDIKLDELAINTSELKNISIKDIALQAKVRGKTLKLTHLSANTFGGSLLTTAQINLKPKQPEISFDQQIKAISVEQIATAFGGGDDITGSLNFDVKGKSRGSSQAQLQTNLTGTGQLQIKQPTITTFNIERAYCEIAARVEKAEATQAQSEPAKIWPTGSKLTDLDASFTLKGYKILLDPYTTGLNSLSFRGNAVIDTEKMAFNALAITRLNGDRTSENGCLVKSKTIRDKDIPIRCKDSFANAGAKSCGPDGDFVKQLLQSKVLDKIGDKINLDDDAAEAIDGLLKGLFGR